MRTLLHVYRQRHLPSPTIILSSLLVVEFVASGASWAFAVNLCFLKLDRAVARRLVIADESLLFRLRPTALRVLRDFPVSWTA